MASFHAEFLFYLFYFLLSRFVLLFVCVAWFGGTERRKKTKKENIAFLAFSWIEGFYFFFCCCWWWLYTQSSFYLFRAYMIIYC